MGTSEEIPVTPHGAHSLPLALLVGVFGCLALWFVLGGTRADVPAAPAILVTTEQVAPGARRVPMREPATVVVGGFTHSCNDCHRIFEAGPQQREKRVQHTHIQLRHGMNDNCFNCHSRQDRNSLTLTSGQLISYNDVPRLCAQCHGTVFRDWQRGTHGKTLGSWDVSSGKQTRLTCNECHDPHAPAYPGIAPLPAPVTLRMGEQPAVVVHEHGKHAPIPEGAARAHATHAAPASNHQEEHK